VPDEHGGIEAIDQNKSRKCLIQELAETRNQLSGERQQRQLLAQELAELKSKQLPAQEKNLDMELLNRILRVFAISSGDEVFGKVLDIVCEGMASQHGVFGYIAEPGHLICPSLSKMLNECEIAGKCIHYPPAKWKGLWARSLREKRAFYTNQPVSVPTGHLPIKNNLAAPILFQGEVIGLINLANKSADYTQIDLALVEAMADRIAPLLYAWIQKKLREMERTRAEVQLRESQQRVRRKLENVLSPEGDLGVLELADLIDANSFQVLMNDFFALSHIPMSIIDVKGRVLVGVGWQDICTGFHRVHPNTCCNCLQSDTHLSSGLAKGEYRLYKCKNNMWDMATPIFVAGHHLGNIFTGQFFFDDETVDRELFRLQAREHGFNEEEYLVALDLVPRLSREAVNQGISFFLKLAGMISQLCFSNVKLARLLTERNRLTDSLKQSSAKLEAALSSMTDAVLICDSKGRFIDFNDAFAKFHRFKNKDECSTIFSKYPDIVDACLPDGTKAAQDLWAVPRALRGEIATNAEYTLKRKDTGETWAANFSFGPIRDKDGMIVGSVVVGRDITERKKMEQSLRQSERHLRNVLNNMVAMIGLMTPDGTLIEANQTALEMANLKSEDVTGKLFEQCFWWNWSLDEQTRLRDAIKRAGRGQSSRYDAVIRAGDVEFRDIDFMLSPMRGAGGHVTYLIASATDITERKRAEQALFESEERYRSLFQNNHAVMLLIEPQSGTIIEANPAACAYYGYTLDEITKIKISDINLLPSEHVRSDMHLARLEQRKHFFFKHRLADGQVRDVEVFSGPISVKGRKLLYSIVHDITDRKRAEEALRQSESFHRQILESIPGMVFTTLADGYCDYQSQQWVDYTGVPMDEHLGNGWSKLLHPKDQPRALAAWQAAVEGKAPYDLEYRVRRKDGIYEWFRVIGRPIRNDDGKIVRWFGVLMNIEDLKEAENANLKHTQRIELLATVAERLLASEDPQLIIKDLCTMVMAHLDCQIFFSYLVETPDQNLNLTAYAGIPPQAAAEIQEFDYSVAMACGCIARHESRNIEDIQDNDDPRVQLVKSYGVQAYCCLPLMAQGKFIGTLFFGTCTRPEFTGDEISLMKSISDQVAVAMQRLLAEKTLQQLNKSLKEQVAQRTALAESRARQLQELAVELIEAEEKERQKISQLLHDDLQQLLASARMQLQVAMESVPPDTCLKNVELLMTDAINKSRNLSHELSPPVLHHSGIVSALMWLIQKMNDQFGLKVEFKADEIDHYVNATFKVFIFRSVQELLFNIVKHSGVKNASIDLCNSQTGLVLRVSDQGKGFNPESFDNAGASSGLGLLSMRERANRIGGTLVIESFPGQGCRLTLTLPYSTAIEEPKGAPHFQPVDIVANNISDNKEIRVLFADDHKVMRRGLIQLIAGQPGIQFIGEAANGQEAVELSKQLKPDLVLMDVSMPLMDGIEATRRIKAEVPQAQVIGLSMFEDEQAAQAMRRSGADAYISKTASTSELLQEIYNVINKGVKLQ
jgi:PAS domain S-box-containing protein